jgi:hypothetical protein
MPFRIIEFEPTPNPNAVKCWLDAPISDRPRSFLNREMAEADPIARRLFEEAGVVCVLFSGTWIAVNKPAAADWATVKRAVRGVLETV